jgi:hypothetical protein
MKSTEGTVRWIPMKILTVAHYHALFLFHGQRRFIEKGSGRGMIEGFVSRVIASTWGVVDF